MSLAHGCALLTGSLLMTAPLLANALPDTDSAMSSAPSDTQTLVVHGSRAVASGYEARGTDVEHVEVDDAAIMPASMSELLSSLSGVAESGQGGWLQMWSVRGVSRQRVLTFVAGIPIITDRRAGTAAHFVDPALLGEATVMAGPASSIYGVGALGGIVQFFPRELAGAVAGIQLDDNGDGRGGYAGWGNGDLTLMLAGLSRDNSEAADGRAINDHGDRWSALWRQRWQLANGELEFLAMPSRIRDMGRANANFYNGRIFSTPEEDHLPLRLSYRANSGWEAAAFVHDNQVRNETDRIGVSLTTTDNVATDTGLSVHWPWQGENWQARIGVDWLGRLAVETEERSYTIAADSWQSRQALADGEEQQLSLFAEMETPLFGGEVQLGARTTALRQSADAERAVSDSAYAAHLGWERLFAERWFVFSSIGQAVRFPALTERFYNGATGRGTLIGNAELEPETARTGDVGLRTRWAGAVITGQFYYQKFDDYIEQVVVQDDPQINTYINLSEGRIRGAELDARWQVSDSLQLSVSAHRLRGEDGDGNPLADIPANRWQLGLEQQWQQCGVALNWSWRKSKRDPGPDEIALAAADYGSASLRCSLGDHWRAALVVSNASDELYWANADSQAALMPGRRVSVRLSWQ